MKKAREMEREAQTAQAAQTQVQWGQREVAVLTSMGFSGESSVQALTATDGDTEQAANLLLQQAE